MEDVPDDELAREEEKLHQEILERNRLLAEAKTEVGILRQLTEAIDK